MSLYSVWKITDVPDIRQLFVQSNVHQTQLNSDVIQNGVVEIVSMQIKSSQPKVYDGRRWQHQCVLKLLYRLLTWTLPMTLSDPWPPQVAILVNYDPFFISLEWTKLDVHFKFGTGIYVGHMLTLMSPWKTLRMFWPPRQKFMATLLLITYIFNLLTSEST